LISPSFYSWGEAAEQEPAAFSCLDFKNPVHNGKYLLEQELKKDVD
jgi:hypothetical protein